MLGLIQRVNFAKVEVDKNIVGEIEHGILALIGLESTDTQKQAEKLIQKILAFRIFDDADGKMNLSVADKNGGLLLVSQFTLVAETDKGTRPGFSRGMPPKEAELVFNNLVNFAKESYPKVQSGIFGANMQVTLCNDGPVTFTLKT